MESLVPPSSGLFGKPVVPSAPIASPGLGVAAGTSGMGPATTPLHHGPTTHGKVGKADFDALEAESRKLTAHIPFGEAAPPLMKGLNELGQAYKILGGGTADVDMGMGHTVEGADREQRALRLLAEKNFDAGEATRQVAAMEMQPTYEPLEPLGPVDMEGYLAHHHDMIVLTAIEETRAESETRVKGAHRRRLASKWEDDKKRLLQNLGAKSGQWAHPTMPSRFQTDFHQRKSQFQGMALTAHADGALSAIKPGGFEDRSLSEMTLPMRQHASVVDRLNQPFLRPGGPAPPGGSGFSTAIGTAAGRTPKPFAEFMKLSAGLEHGPPGSLHHHVYSGYHDSWRLLGSVMRESSEEPVNSKTRLVGSSKYLEELFLEHLRIKVENATAQGQLKLSARKLLEPGIRPDVADFVQVQISQGHIPLASTLNAVLVTDQPLWPQVYYCLRCGSPSAAAEVVQVALQEGASGVDRAIADALIGLANGQRDSTAEAKAQELYEYMMSRTLVHEIDPFYAVCLSLISNFDADVKPAYRDAIEVTIEDFIWMGLWFARRKDNQLSKLQSKVLKWGQRHFDKEGRTPFSYARILFLVQLFERGLNYLLQAGLLLEGTHLALALNTYKVLDVDVDSQDSVNLSQLLLDYTHSFQRSDPEIALEYILQLKHCENEALLNRNLLHLLMSTSQLNKLVGELQPDGRRLEVGSLDRYLKPQKVEEVLCLAGSSALDKGLFVEAVNLLAFGGAYKDVVAVLVSQLGVVLVPPNTHRKLWYDKASAFYSQHLPEGQRTFVRSILESSNEGVAIHETFVKLMNLMVFFDKCEAQQYSEAIFMLDQLSLLPLNPSDVQQKLAYTKELHPALKRNFSEILLKGMECIFNLYSNLKQRASSVTAPGFGVAQNDATSQKLVDYKEKANILVTFCGLMSNQLPHDTAARLARMEVMMI